MSVSFYEMGVEAQRPVAKARPWMSKKEMSLVTEETLTSVIDECIAAGRYAIDLETTGLDNRVFEGRTKAQIVGVCLSPDGVKGYYIPIRHKKGSEHNLPIPKIERELRRLANADSVGIFHNAKFDCEFLQFAGGEAIGWWDDPKKWEDTLILAWLRNPREKRKGLKHLSKNELGFEMIELKELFPPDYTGDLDFSLLDPSEESVVLYGCSDAICTYCLFDVLYPQVIAPGGNKRNGQAITYNLEKMTVPATRWMERCRVMVDQDKVAELMQLGQQEYFDCLVEVYDFCNTALGRSIEPGWFQVFRQKFQPDDVDHNINEQIHECRLEAKRDMLDALDAKGHYIKVEKELSSGNKQAFPEKYDILSRPQLGPLFEELEIPGLRRTEKSKQVMTTQGEIERLDEEHGSKYPFLPKIKRLGELQKALGTYLISLRNDVGPDGTLRIHYQQLGTDTGRFTTPSSSDPRQDGGTKYPMHGTPASYDKSRPQCLLRIREAIVARPGKVIIAADFSGVELRIATNLSGEPKWLREFFRCSTCGQEFDQGDGVETPIAPPVYCPRCGDDRIGDLHTLTGLAFFGENLMSGKDKKQLRGQAKCVHPDTLILTQDGLKPLRDLPQGEEDTFQKVEGELWNGFQEVPLKATYNGGTKPLYHVITQRGALTCSENHRFQMADGSLRSIAQGLREGDTLLMPEETPQLKEGTCPVLPIQLRKEVPELQIQTSEELAYFCGLYCGDGIKGGTRSVGLAHGHTDKADVMDVPYSVWQDHLMSVCAGLGFNPVARDTSVYLGSVNTMRYMEALGLFDDRGNRALRIPSWVLQGGREATLQFLGGMFDTEGTVNIKDKAGSITTKDAVFFGQLVAALQALGLTPRSEACWNTTYERYYYRLFIRKSEMWAIKPYVRHPGKQNRIEPCSSPDSPIDNHVLAIVPAGSGPCMDVSVDTDDHLYWCNGLITHNSSNFALAYGGGPKALIRAAGIPEQDAARHHQTFNRTYTILKDWWAVVRAFGHKHGFVLTALGRQYPIPDIQLPITSKECPDPQQRELNKKFRAKAERNATNGPIQGTSADITKLAMALIYREVKKRDWFEKVFMTITIHDELVFEIDKDILVEAQELFQEIMTRNKTILRLKWRVPLTTDCEIGYNWTVPYDVKEFRFKRVRRDGMQLNEKGKETGKVWPAELVRLFGARYGYADDTPSEGPVGAPTEPESTPEQAPVEESLTPSPVSQQPSLALGRGEIFEFRLRSWGVGSAVKLAEVVVRCEGRGMNPLRVLSPSGENALGDKDLVFKVNPIQFEAFAEAHGL